MATALTAFNSVEGLLGHLDDEDDEVIETSLQSLLELIPYHWAEIADELTKIEALSEDDDFPFNKVASLLASKIFFHIQSYEDSLNHALCAGDLFNVAEATDYVKKLTEQCIDSYRTYKQTEYTNQYESKQSMKDSNEDSDSDDESDSEDSDTNMANKNEMKSNEASEQIDPRKVKIVEQVFEYCYQIGDFKPALGIAIECRRIDRVEQSIQLSNNSSEMMRHCFNLCETVINSRTFRDVVLRLIVKLFNVSKSDNYNTICRCYFYLDETKPISDILWTLINTDSSTDNHLSELTAYQIGFDLTEYQNDAFLRGIFNNIPRPPFTQLYPDKMPKKADAQPPKDNTDNPDSSSDALTEPTDIAMTAMNVDAEANTDADKPEEPSIDTSKYWSDELLSKWKQLKSILLGEIIIPSYLDFLFRNCHSDMLILKKIKDGISERNSVLNNSLICCNGIMHCGTTIDQFLRDNLEWMGRAAHWSKFTTTATVGMIHNKHLSESMNILSRYLPGSGGGPYQEGGALYALGLIHFGDNSDVTVVETRKYLLKHLKSASNEILQHGSCLGLGLACFGYGTQSGGGVSAIIDKDDEDEDSDSDEDEDEESVTEEAKTQSIDTGMDNGGPSASEILTEIRNILFQDRAVPGQSAGLALGLILCGSGNKQWYEEMIAYSHETQHEKIIRGLVLGIAIIFYNLQEQAQYVINKLISDKSEVIRYGGCYCIGLAYAATGNTSAISLLLHLAVSDVSNDVRRAAVTNIGFVLCNKPKQVPKVVGLLANSYNEHVRYGSAAALGIACAGTGNEKALSILKTLIKDKVDYVRQSALIAIGMVLQQSNSEASKEMRENVLQSIAIDKREPTMCQMGAILGCGLIDCSGRNSAIQMFNTFNNCKKQYSIIGMAIFWQYWYWYPLIPFITLALQPTMIMSLDHKLKMCKINVVSKEKNKELFKYVKNIESLDTNTKKKKKIKVSLSIAAKTKQRTEKRKEEKKEEKKEDTDIEMKEKDDKKEKESDSGLLPNPSRVTPNQIKYIEWIDQRYQPMTKRLYGFVMVQDSKPNQKVQYVEQTKIKSGGIYGDEPKPPKPFLYLGQ